MYLALKVGDWAFCAPSNENYILYSIYACMKNSSNITTCKSISNVIETNQYMYSFVCQKLIKEMSKL